MFEAVRWWRPTAPIHFRMTTPADDDAIHCWNTKLVAHHVCPTRVITTSSDSAAFEPDGHWDKHTRRIGVNGRLFDDFDAAAVAVKVIDG